MELYDLKEMETSRCFKCCRVTDRLMFLFVALDFFRFEIENCMFCVKSAGQFVRHVVFFRLIFNAYDVFMNFLLKL